jgi:hypothetical protein
MSEEQTKFKLLAVQVGEQDGHQALMATAVEWNMDTHKGEQIPADGKSMGDYVDEVLKDMGLLVSGTVSEMKDRRVQGANREQILMDILAGLIGLPVEVTHNMLASLLLISIDESEVPEVNKG